MIINNIDKILKKQNKTRYWLHKQTGIGYQHIMNLCQNTTKSIKYSTLEKICYALDCTPNDILKFK